MKLAVLGLLVLVIAVFAIQSYRTWRLIDDAFATSSYVVKPLEGAVKVTSRVLMTKSNRRVGAFWVPPKNGAAVLLLHGTHTDRSQLWPELQTLGSAGFGVLAIDWPGSGESDGPCVVGVPEREAFTAAVDMLAAEPAVQNIGVLAFSQGAALGAMYAADDSRVKSLLAVGAWTDALEQTHYEFRHGGILRQWPAYFIARHYTGTPDGNVRPIDVAAKLKGRPTLFVSGTLDDIVPPQMSKQLAEATGGEFWSVEGAGHNDFREHTNGQWPVRMLMFFAPLAKQ